LLVPWLAGYEGWALFIDVDMLCQGDIAEIGLDPKELVAGFGECFQQSLEVIGFGSGEAHRRLRRAMAI
jgi:hypothetical protein